MNVMFNIGYPNFILDKGNIALNDKNFTNGSTGILMALI